ncbi:unnamed protein product [Closterium sp. NIES-53]
MASYSSTGTYVDEVPPPGANVVDGMWIFRVKRPPGSPPVFKARYVARGQRDYELLSLDFSTVARLLSFRVAYTRRFRRPDYGLRQAPREWHDTLRSTLSDLGYQPSSANPSLFVHRGSTQFFVLVYRDRLALTLVLQQLELQHSTVQCTPLAVGHRLTGPFRDEQFEPSSPYAELVGCLLYLMNCNRPDLMFPLSILARFVTPGRHRPVHWTVAVRVAKYLATTLGMGLVLGGRQDVMLTGHCDSSYADDAETHRSTQGCYFNLGSRAVSWRSTRSSSVSNSTAEAKIYAGAMATQELRWLTFFLTNLGERPSTVSTLFTDNKAAILLCREPRLESRVKHMNVR